MRHGSICSSPESRAARLHVENERLRARVAELEAEHRAIHAVLDAAGLGAGSTLLCRIESLTLDALKRFRDGFYEQRALRAQAEGRYESAAEMVQRERARADGAEQERDEARARADKAEVRAVDVDFFFERVADTYQVAPEIGSMSRLLVDVTCAREERDGLRARADKAEQERDEQRKIAADGRKAGRREAAEILLRRSPERLDDLIESVYGGQDYSEEWVRERVLAFFDADAPATVSLLDRQESDLYRLIDERDEQRARADKAEQDRDEARAKAATWEKRARDMRAIAEGQQTTLEVSNALAHASRAENESLQARLSARAARILTLEAALRAALRAGLSSVCVGGECGECPTCRVALALGDQVVRVARDSALLGRWYRYQVLSAGARRKRGAQ